MLMKIQKGIVEILRKYANVTLTVILSTTRIGKYKIFACCTEHFLKISVRPQILSFVTSCGNTENMMLNEINQTKKDKGYMLALRCETWKR